MLQLKTSTLMITTDSTPIQNSILMPCVFQTVVVLLTHNVVTTLLMMVHMFFITLLTKNAALMVPQHLLDLAKMPNSDQTKNRNSMRSIEKTSLHCTLVF